MLKLLLILDNIFVKVSRFLSTICFLILFIMLAFNVLSRFVPVISFGWFDEIVELAFAWMVFIGAALLWRNHEHFEVELIHEKFEGKKIGYVAEIILTLISLTFLAILTYYGWSLTMLAQDTSPIFKLSRKLFYICIPISGSFMIIYSIRDLIGHITGLITTKDPIKAFYDSQKTV